MWQVRCRTESVETCLPAGFIFISTCSPSAALCSTLVLAWGCGAVQEHGEVEQQALCRPVPELQRGLNCCCSFCSEWIFFVFIWYLSELRNDAVADGWSSIPSKHVGVVEPGLEDVCLCYWWVVWGRAGSVCQMSTSYIGIGQLFSVETNFQSFWNIFGKAYITSALCGQYRL